MANMWRVTDKILQGEESCGLAEGSADKADTERGCRSSGEGEEWEKRWILHIVVVRWRG